MLPGSRRARRGRTHTAGRYFGERLVRRCDATFRVLQHLRIVAFSKLLHRSPRGSGAMYQQGELLNRIVADVDTLDHLYLRHLPAGRRFCSDYDCRHGA